MAENEREGTTPQGQKLYIHEWIPENVRGTIVLVHGLGEYICRYAHVAQALNKAGYAVFGFDLPGHGRTEGTRGHIRSYEQVNELIAFILGQAAAAYPDRPRFLYGHSLGGALVLYYGITEKPQLNGMIATSPVMGTGSPVPAWKMTLGKILYNLAPSFQLESGLDASGISRLPEVVTAYQADPLIHSHVSARLGLDLIQNGQWILDHAADFPKIPLLLLQGEQDRIVSPQATEAFAKKCGTNQLTFKMWNGLYHELHNEAEKEEVFQFIINWLDQQRTTDSRP